MESKDVKFSKNRRCEGCELETYTCWKSYDVFGDPNNIDTTCYDEL